MTGGVIGADVAQLRAAAAELDRAADRLASVRTELGAQLARTPWTGQDAASFRSAWTGAHAPRVQSAADRLREAASVLRRNADAQETTSAAAGGSLLAPGPGGAPTGPGSAPVASAPPAGASPAEITQWWQDHYGNADRGALEDMIRANPEDFGRFDGMPAWVRDIANREILAQQLASMDPAHAPVAQGSWDSRAADWVQKYITLQNVQRMLEGDPSLSLLVLDARDDSRVEVAFASGDVDTADHVGVFTQGLFSSTANAQGTQDAVTSMNELRRESESILLREGRGDESVAMITWMGYDSPQGADVLFDGDARAGATRLESFADGVRAINPQTHLSGLGHSYGSLVTSLAAQRTDAFDDVALFGSPGIEAESGSQLRVPEGHVYALATPWDPVASSGHFGPVPTHMPGCRSSARLRTASCRVRRASSSSSIPSTSSTRAPASGIWLPSWSARRMR